MNDRNRGWVAAFLLLGIAFLSAIFAAQGALLTAMIDAYALRASSQGEAALILRLNNGDKAAKLFQMNNVKTLSQEQVDAL